MLFPTVTFALFFALLWIGLRVLERGRNALLLVASLLFYASAQPSHLLLLLATVAVNHALLRAMAARGYPRALLALSVGGTLTLLATFKYAALALETLAPVLATAGLQAHPPSLGIPLGISFYCFEIISIAVDSARTRSRTVPSLFHYMLFIAFFPHLIAGPILRGEELMPQLEAGPRPSNEKTQRGLWLIAAGLVKKVIFADFLLSGFVLQVFATGDSFGAPHHWIAMYSFAFQIYFDFSGYTDMARGLSLLLGYELPRNFLEPYLSRNPSEFWRRWHITLSRWLRDYLYIPLGGSRKGAARTYANLCITMLLGGLWHGAAWKFVLWGGLHGAMLAVHRWWAGEARSREDRPLRLADGAKIAVLFHLVCFAWIFFRAETFGDAASFASRLVTGGAWATWPLLQCGLIAAFAGLHVLERHARERVADWQQLVGGQSWGPYAEGAVLGATLATVILTAGQGVSFIYFQF
jgi:alginate O-acetyltransferase complex protein AlgI